MPLKGVGSTQAGASEDKTNSNNNNSSRAMLNRKLQQATKAEGAVGAEGEA